MKSNRMITLDHEVNTLLSREDNASGLINELLFKHYKHSTMSEQEIVQEVKDKIRDEGEKEKAKAKKDAETERLRNAILKEMDKDA